ncbi:uncharacterized protein LOC134192573 [Corticium candelabrum]|uniref:uncharacterized protein LOC134192573 n=1 Tax=Corticium candelabrum TaxID=121492 RepID=UPI002E258AF2|nr:uncharacterized protein LOC134192573 [Corticium candelabrum]
MNSCCRGLLILFSVIILLMCFVLNLITYDCSVIKYAQSSIPNHCQSLDSSNVAYIDTWGRALNGSILVLCAFAVIGVGRYKKVAMAVLGVGGIQLIIASGFCFKAYYLSINYPGGACCYSLSIDTCVVSDVARQCPKDWFSQSASSFVSGKECSVPTCWDHAPNATHFQDCTNITDCKRDETCSQSPPLVGKCICKPGYGRSTKHACLLLGKHSQININKLSGASVFQSLLTVLSAVISVVLLVALHRNIQYNKSSSGFTYTHTEHGIAMTDVATSKQEQSPILIN